MRLPSVNPSLAVGHAVVATSAANDLIEAIFPLQQTMKKQKDFLANAPIAREEQRMWRDCIAYLTSALQFCRVAEVQTRVFTNPDADKVHPAGLINMARNIARFASRSTAVLKLKRATAYYCAGMYTLATGDLDSIDLHHNEVTADIVVAARIIFALCEVASGAPAEKFTIEKSLLEGAEGLAKGSTGAAKAIMAFVDLQATALKEARKDPEANGAILREGLRVEFPCVFPTKLDIDVEKHILGLLSGSKEVQATLEVMKRYTSPIDVVRITSCRRDELKDMPVCNLDAPLTAGRLVYVPERDLDAQQVRTSYIVPPPIETDECAKHIQNELVALCQLGGIPTDQIELRYVGPGKGYGMFAKKDIPTNTLILKEKPLFGISMSARACQVCLRSTKKRRLRCRNYQCVVPGTGDVDCEHIAYCSETCRAFDEVFHRTAFSCGIQTIPVDKRTPQQAEILKSPSPGRVMMTRMATDTSLIPFMIIRVLLRLRQREQEDMIKRGVEHPTSAVLSGQGTHPCIDVFDLCPDLAVLSAAMPLQLAVTSSMVQVYRSAYRVLMSAQQQHISSLLPSEERRQRDKLERATSATSSSSRDHACGNVEADDIAFPIVEGNDDLPHHPLPINNIFATENLDLRTYLHLYWMIRTNTFASPDGALELFTVTSMFNHSCNPNTERVIYRFHDGSSDSDLEDGKKSPSEVFGARKDNYKTEDVFVDSLPLEAAAPSNGAAVSSSAAIAEGPTSGVRTRRPIKAGEELFLSYIEIKGRSVYERRTLLNGYGFRCECPKCCRELEV